jgi:hypothetical protein
MCRTEMASPTVPLAAAMSSCCCAAETPLLNVAMYGTGAGEAVPVGLEEVSAAVVVSVELAEVSVEGAVVVSVVEASLAAVVSVLVEPSTDSDWPNAPDAISPNANRTASPIPIRRDRFRNVR